jgi:hypothetical protein
MDSGQEKWKSLYEFDTPVVGNSIEVESFFDDMLVDSCGKDRSTRQGTGHPATETNASIQGGRCSKIDG